MVPGQPLDVVFDGLHGLQTRVCSSTRFGILDEELLHLLQFHGACKVGRDLGDKTAQVAVVQAKTSDELEPLFTEEFPDHGFTHGIGSYVLHTGEVILGADNVLIASQNQEIEECLAVQNTSQSVHQFQLLAGIGFGHEQLEQLFPSRLAGGLLHSVVVDDLAKIGRRSAGGVQQEGVEALGSLLQTIWNSQSAGRGQNRNPQAAGKRK